MSGADKTAEFSRVVSVESLDGTGRALEFEACGEELEAVRRRLGLDGLSSLRAKARLLRTGRDRVRVDIDFRADVLQSCVVTLEPVRSLVSETGAAWFQQDADPADEPDLLDPDAPDPPEPLVEGRIDVGELIVQHLALALDPYPRAEGANVGDVLPPVGEIEEGADGDAQDSAFAVLARLKGR